MERWALRRSLWRPLWRLLQRPIAGVFACLGVGGLVGTAAGFTPNSPEVQNAVARAVKFLESPAANDARPGAQALMALALLKNGADSNHPKVAWAAQSI